MKLTWKSTAWGQDAVVVVGELACEAVVVEHPSWAVLFSTLR